MLICYRILPYLLPAIILSGGVSVAAAAPSTPPAVPVVKGPTNNPIDNFIKAKWEAADRRGEGVKGSRGEGEKGRRGGGGRRTVTASQHGRGTRPAVFSDRAVMERAARIMRGLGSRHSVARVRGHGRLGSPLLPFSPSPPLLYPSLCDDATFVRRVYLDVAGVVPTAEQSRAFVENGAPDKRAKLIDALLAEQKAPIAATTQDPREVVNVLWKRYLGLGLAETTPGSPADTAPSHPELLAWLADQYTQSQGDVKAITRLILNSRTYQLRYDPRLADASGRGHAGEPRLFRSPALRKMDPDQRVRSLEAALSDATPGQSADAAPTSSRAGEKDCSPTAVRDSVTASRLASDLSQLPDPDEVVLRAYWSVLTRPPAPAEMGAGIKLLVRRADPQPRARAVFYGKEPLEVAPPTSPAGATTARREVVDLICALVASPCFQEIH